MKNLFTHPRLILFDHSVKKTVLLVLIILFSTLHLFSKEVEKTKVKRVAINCFAEKTDKNPDQIEILEVLTEEKNDLSLIHIYNFKNGGYVIVAADNVSLPIIGYSEKGKFNKEEIPPALQNLLEFYKEQIYQLIVQDAAPYETTPSKWEFYLSGANIAPVEGLTSVLPLLTTAWDQGKYYNTLCPSVSSGGDDGYVWAGCVATAMAQVLYYWSHPWYGEGSHGYTHEDYGYLDADFGNTLYNYDLMDDTLTDYNVQVETLIYHCAVSVDMNFGPDGSGAWGWDEKDEVPDALKDYFYFSGGTQGEKRSSHPIAWHDMIKGDLDLGRPVIYSGKDLIDDNGHAWVIDGYNDDFYHMNWGWGGNHDDWFTIDNLAPPPALPGDFNDYQLAVFGARPEVGNIGGTITLAESPYVIHYPREVPSGMLLTIEPGVEIVFRGRYPLNVVGQMEALGTASDTIVFRAENEDIGWAGVRLSNSIHPDSSRFSYCKFTGGYAYHRLKNSLGISSYAGRNHGGAVYCRSAPAVSFINCLFEDNFSDEQGGALYCEDGSDILIKNSTIRRNEALTQGGGISINGSSPLITGSYICENRNHTSGGGIWLQDGTLELINDSIYRNKAKFGGGLASYNDATLSMSNVHIVSDTSVNGGGGLYCYFYTLLNLDDVTIRDNFSGGEGAGILISGSDLNMTNSLVINNFSDSIGGGMHCGFNTNVSLENTLIAWNYADSAAGVYISDNNTFNMDRVTLCRNTATHTNDELIIKDGNLTGKNSIIWYSPSDDIKIEGASNVSFTYSDIKGGEGKSWFGTGCIDVNPLFENPYFGNFNLTWDQYPEPLLKSPCIDTGDPSSSPDPDGTSADMGAIPFEQVYTPLPGGDLNGVLTCSGSPYYVNGNLTLPSGEELMIEPCVYLVFRGDYYLRVNGRLLAEGTESQKIGFMPSDTVEGWGGISFYNLNSNGQDSSKLVNCRIFYGNAAGYYENGQGGGIYASQSSNLLISDSYFYRNRSDINGGAIYLGNHSSPLIRRCSFLENESSYGGAISCYGTVDAVIEDCIMKSNHAEYGGGISAVSCAPLLAGTSMLNNYATRFGGGLYRSGGQVPEFNALNRCNVYDNYADLAGLDFYSEKDVYIPPETDVFLDSGSVNQYHEHFAFPIHLFNVSLNQAHFIQESVDLYVSPVGSDANSGTSSSDPLQTIKRAHIKIVADENNPRKVYLADGMYSRSGSGEQFPINLRKHVSLVGESRKNTVIDGVDLYQLMTSYGDTNSSVHMLILQHGYRDGSGGAVHIEHYTNPTFNEVTMQNNYSEEHGGAVWCYNHSSPTFSNVSFLNNYSDNSGGAVYSQTNDTVLFDNVRLASNTARHSGGGIHAGYDEYCWIRNADFFDNEVFNGGGGGATLRSASFRLDSVLFEDNLCSNSGGALFGYGLDLKINNSSFISNDAEVSGGGMYFYHSADVTMENVIFNTNSSLAGGAIYGLTWSTLKINNGLFVNNSTLYDPYNTGDGGAMNLRDVETTFNNVTVTNNAADGDGGGMYCWNNTFSIQNSIFWGNTGAQIYVDGATLDVQYSDIEGSWTGTGNIDVDPMFANPTLGDYSLQASSLCINTGNPDTIGKNLPYFDLTGSPRISEDLIDMGAYEFFSGFELDLKVFLQGPFNGTNMNTEYSNLGILPLTQPFFGAPWSYSGLEEVVSFPEDNIVDWLLIEVRDATDITNAVPGSSIGQQAVFLLSDGSVLDINGNDPRFGNSILEQCFLVIRHKNHQSIISAYPLTLVGNVYDYDFTTPAGQAYDTDAQFDLGGGLYGMYGGDADADGTINILDKSVVWDVQAGQSGYLSGDFNLDGEVDNRDKNDVWVENEGKESQVPE